ncbi:MAG: hypothetical protein ACLGSH_08295 [Acidobacteriota bacterium]
MAVVNAILAGIIIVLLSNEITAWLPALPKLLVAKAARRLPEELRARYEEEWEADLQEIPGDLTRVLYSLGLQVAGRRIRRSQPTSVKPIVERVIDEIHRPLGLTLGLLPEPEGRAISFVFSLAINAAILVTALLVGAVAKDGLIRYHIHQEAHSSGVVQRAAISADRSAIAQPRK